MLFEEDWEHGTTTISGAVWKSLGSPSPIIRTGGDVKGTYSLDPNGDSFYLYTTKIPYI